MSIVLWFNHILTAAAWANQYHRPHFRINSRHSKIEQLSKSYHDIEMNKVNLAALNDLQCKTLKQTYSSYESQTIEF
jgi:hypothetical protein